VTGPLFCPVSSTNKTDCHDIAEILLKVALNTIINQLNDGKSLSGCWPIEQKRHKLNSFVIHSQQRKYS
jgi:hypothetical protein